MNSKLFIPQGYLYSIIVQTLLASFGWCLFANVAQARECPYDSYMVINGKCVNIPAQKRPAKSVRFQSDDYGSDNSSINIDIDSFQNRSTYNSDAKTCRDFTYQDEAQDYALKKPDDFLDSDNDGIVCEYLPWRKYGYLDKSKYTAVKNEYYRRKQSQTFGFRNGITMTISEVQDIVGFPGLYVGNSTWVWGNILKPKQQIKIKVQANQITGVNKKGF